LAFLAAVSAILGFGRAEEGNADAAGALPRIESASVSVIDNEPHAFYVPRIYRDLSRTHRHLIRSESAGRKSAPFVPMPSIKTLRLKGTPEQPAGWKHDVKQGHVKPVAHYKDKWRIVIKVSGAVRGLGVIAWFGVAAFQKKYAWRAGTAQGEPIRFCSDAKGKVVLRPRRYDKVRNPMGHLPFRLVSNELRGNWAAKYLREEKDPELLERNRRKFSIQMLALEPGRADYDLYAYYHFAPSTQLLSAQSAFGKEKPKPGRKYWVFMPYTVALVKDGGSKPEIVQCLHGEFSYLLDLSAGEWPLNALITGRFMDAGLDEFLDQLERRRKK